MLAEKPPWNPLSPGAVKLNVRPSAASVACNAALGSAAADAGQALASNTGTKQLAMSMPIVTAADLCEGCDECKEIAGNCEVSRALK